MPDPPPPLDEFVFARADMMYDGQFRPTVSPSGKVPGWAAPPPPPPPIAPNLAPPTPLPPGVTLHPELQPPPVVVDVAAARLAQSFR